MTYVFDEPNEDDVPLRDRRDFSYFGVGVVQDEEAEDELDVE